MLLSVLCLDSKNGHGDHTLRELSALIGQYVLDQKKPHMLGFPLSHASGYDDRSVLCTPGFGEQSEASIKTKSHVLVLPVFCTRGLLGLVQARGW